jgi:hypothetical protein
MFTISNIKDLLFLGGIMLGLAVTGFAWLAAAINSSGARKRPGKIMGLLCLMGIAVAFSVFLLLCLH